MRNAPAPAALAATCVLLILTTLLGCAGEKPYGVEERLAFPADAPRQVWAVAPAVNLSGESGVDPLLQADLLFARLQAVRGVTVVPVNRVAEAYVALGISGIDSYSDAAAVREMLGVDAVVVPTVTLYNPYDPPTMGAALQLFLGPGSRLGPASLPSADAVRGLTRAGSATTALATLPGPGEAGEQMVQRAGIFDARDGSVRRAALAYWGGRFDPTGPAGQRGIFLVADEFAGFVYHALLADVLDDLNDLDRLRRPPGP